jgi:hypothetical protein
MWRVDALLGGDQEISNCTAAVAMQRLAKQLLNRKRKAVLSVWSRQRLVKTQQTEET